MALKSNAGINPRSFAVAIGGDDRQSGENEETAKQTLQSVIDEVNLLIPPPDVSNPSSILTSGSGFFFENNLDFPEGCLFNGESIFNFSLDGDCFFPGERSLFNIVSAGVLGDNSIVITVNNRSSVGVTASAIIVRGLNCTGIHILGTSDESTMAIGQMVLDGAGSTGVLDQTDNGSPEIYNINTINLEADNTTGFQHDPTNPASKSVINSSFIGNVGSPTGTTAVHVINGEVDAIISSIIADDAIVINIGGTLDLFASDVIGAITVDVGATLNCYIQNHTGIITNNGTINGFINGDRFGKGNSESTSLTEGGLITEGALNTQIDITAGSGTIYDYSVPAAIEVFPLEFGPFTDVDLTFAASELFSWITIDRTGAVVQFEPEGLTFEIRRDYLVLGTVTHPSGIFQTANSNYITARETHAQLLDLLDCLGVIRCDGLVVDPNADLTFDKTAGILMNPGAGNILGNRAENATEIQAESPTVFSRSLGITANTSATMQTDIDPDNYDDGSGTPQSIGGSPNRSTIQYIFQFPVDGAVFVQYGQTIYDDLFDAVALANSDNPIIPQFIRNDALLVARIAVERSATDLTDESEAIFLSGAKFGVDIAGGSGGTGTGGGDVFGPASSLEDEIPTYDDLTGKVIKSTSDISALTGDIQRLTTDGDLRIIQSGTGAVQFGLGNILSNMGASNIGTTIFSVATPLAGDARVQFEHNGLPVGDIGYMNFNDHLRFLDALTGKGMFIESDGQISLGEFSVDPDFSVIINGDEKPFGLPNLTTANEGALTPQQRMLHYNSILDRVRYYDGTAFRSVASLDDVSSTPLSILKYVDFNTTSTSRDGSIGNPYFSTGEARSAILDNAIGKQYTLIVVEDDGTSNDPKPFIYQRGVNRENFTGGARIPNIVGRFEYSNMTVGNVNSDNLTVAAETVFTDVNFLAGSLIFTISDTTPATAKFIRCRFGGKMDFRQVEAEFIDCEVNAIEFIDGTLTPKTWIFRNCTLGGAITTSGSSIGCNFTFFNCHWLSSSSLTPAWPMAVTCDSTFPHESNGQVTIVSRQSEAIVVDYSSSGSTLASDNVNDAIDELDAKISPPATGEDVFAEAINNGQTTSIGATGVYEHINIDSALSLVSSNNWDVFAGRIRFLGTTFTGIIRMTIEIHVPPASPSSKNYDVRGALNTNVTGIFPTLFNIPAGDYRQRSLEFRVSGLNSGDLIDARIRQLSGAVDQNPIISMATYEAIED